jgi:hypothetical protein
VNTLKNILGQRFGLVVAIRHVGSDHHGKAVWRVRCDCGSEREMTTNRLDLQPPRTHQRCLPVIAPVVQVPADIAECRAQVLAEVHQQWLKLRAAGAFGAWLAGEIQGSEAAE